MNNIKHKISILIFLSFTFFCYCENNEFLKIENIADLCLYAIENNSDICLLKTELKSASKNLTGTYLSYLPVINPKGGIEYIQKDGFNFKEPQAYFFGLELIQRIPGVGILTLNPKVTHEEEFLFSLDYTFTQTTFPFWYKWKGRNPVTNIPRIIKTGAELNFYEAKYNLIDLILTSLQNYKQIIFALKITEKQIELSQIQSKSYSELLETNGGSWMNYFEAEKKLTDYEKIKEELLKEKTELEFELKNLFCTNCDINDFKKVLEKCLDADIKSDDAEMTGSWEKLFISYFPEWTYSFYHEIEVLKLQSVKDMNESEYLLKRENLAPQFYINGNVSYTKENRHDISCTVGFDFSNFLNGEKISYKTEYKQKNLIYEKQLELLKEEKNSRENFYTQNLLEKSNEYIKRKKEVEARKKIMDDMKKLYEQNLCSKTDFMECEIMYFQTFYNFILLDDEITYYKLLLGKL